MTCNTQTSFHGLAAPNDDHLDWCRHLYHWCLAGVHVLGTLMHGDLACMWPCWSSVGVIRGWQVAQCWRFSPSRQPVACTMARKQAPCLCPAAHTLLESRDQSRDI